MNTVAFYYVSSFLKGCGRGYFTFQFQNGVVEFKGQEWFGELSEEEFNEHGRQVRVSVRFQVHLVTWNGDTTE